MTRPACHAHIFVVCCFKKNSETLSDFQTGWIWIHIRQVLIWVLIICIPKKNDEDLHCLFDKTEFTTNCSTVNESSIYFIFLLFLYCCCLLTIFFSKLTFSKASFGNTVRLSNSLDPDQVGADQGPNYLHSKKKMMKTFTVCLIKRCHNKLFYIK